MKEYQIFKLESLLEFVQNPFIEKIGQEITGHLTPDALFLILEQHGYTVMTNKVRKG